MSLKRTYAGLLLVSTVLGGGGWYSLETGAAEKGVAALWGRVIGRLRTGPTDPVPATADENPMSSFTPLITPTAAETPSPTPSITPMVTPSPLPTPLPAGACIVFRLDLVQWICCDTDGDYITEECEDSQSYFLLDTFCEDHSEIEGCGQDQSCRPFLADPALPETVETRGCVSSPDCSDGDDSRYPAFDPYLVPEELCDGKDNDCDDLIDERFDLDGDGVTTDCGGTGYYVGQPVETCDTATGDVSTIAACLTAPDCDDERDDVYPPNPGGASIEICDADDVDEDCSGAADDEDPGTSGQLLYFPDADGDGQGNGETGGQLACDPPEGMGVTWVTNSTDCDDSNPTVFQGAEEVCDSARLDEDCDGLSDDSDPSVSSSSQTVYYPDEDVDGFGDAESSGMPYCDPPALGTALVVDHSDCNDSDAAVNPDADEVCDDLNVDEDCNGLADDEDPGTAPASRNVYYPDVDSDMFGDASDLGVVACDNPGSSDTGFVLDHGDCDDHDSDINPSVPEVCDDAHGDEDCDGLADDADPSTAISSKHLYFPDGDLDLYGDASSSGMAACSDPSAGDDRYSLDGSDCDDGDASINPGALEVCDPNDTDEDCDLKADDADSSTAPSSMTLLYPDADQDSYGDASSPGLLLCEPPSSSQYVTDHSDCGDQDARINPAATEICDPTDLDEDCDGFADDQDASASSEGMTLFYPDNDGDGFGDSGSVGSLYCDDPSTPSETASADHSDCDDTLEADHPGAPEVCDARDNDCDGVVDEDFDADADGVTLCGPDGIVGNPDDDCEDANGQNYPGGTEICDARDNNCDGEVDDGFDADGDGVTTCGGDGQSGTSDDDCAPENPGKFPGNEEKCDGIDQDCDGVVDNDTSVDTLEWWIDRDSDAFGSSASVQYACGQPAGFVLRPTDPDLEDCNDLDPSVFPGAANERLDGFDTNCDGRLPLVELDCDGDGQYPVSRLILAAYQSGQLPSGSLELSCLDKRPLIDVVPGAPTTEGPPNDALYDAANLSLLPCRQGGIPPAFSCLGLETPGDFSVLCDDPDSGGTGFWMVENYADVKPLMDENRDAAAETDCDQDFADCDDQSAEVCGCRAEVCDGVDSNCAKSGYNILELNRFDAYQGGDGLPDAMQVNMARSGYVAARELDLDGDGALVCQPGESLDSFNDDLYSWSSSGLPKVWVTGDCDDRCALKGPDRDELCDGIVDNRCLSAETGFQEDPSAEAGSTALCGYGSAYAEIDQDYIYLLVYDRCPDCPTDASPRYLPLTQLRLTLPQGSPPSCSSQPDCVRTDPVAATLDAVLERVEGQLFKTTGNECLPSRLARVEAAPSPELELLRLCLDPYTSDSHTNGSRCRVLRLRIDDESNETIREHYGALLEQPEVLCSAAYSARTIWSADRVRSARAVVALWQCIQTGSCTCRREDGTLGPVYSDCPEVVQVSQDQLHRVRYDNANDLTGLEEPLPVDIGAFLDRSFVGVPGWLTGCWTNSSSVAGGCADGNRDTAEGPRDIYGRLTGDPAACSSCTDGADNNCNGLVDADEPGCYPCYQGQGIACGCDSSAAGPGKFRWMEGLSALAFFVGWLRCRRRARR